VRGFLLHDLVGCALGWHVWFPEMTLVFALFGIGAVASAALRMDISRCPLALRVGTNLAYVAGSSLIATNLVR
jgi:hypothetical protein